jgi:CBS domain containing-hemolysin-like protein
MKSDSKREVLDTLEKHINKTDSLFTIIGASLLIAILFVGLGIIVPIVVLLTALFAVIRRFTSFLIVIYREAKYLAYPSERLSDLTVKKQKLVSDLRKIQPKLNDSNHQQRVQLLIDDLQRD